MTFRSNTVTVLSIWLASIAGVSAQPMLEDPDRFQIELFAELEDVESLPKAITLLILSDANDFDPGLYFTSGYIPSGHPGKTGVFFISLDGEVRTLTDELDAFALVSPTAQYGEGLIVSDVEDGRLVRVFANGAVETFSEGDSLFGLTFGPDGLLYGTGFDGGIIYRIDENGIRQPFASIPLPEHEDIAFGGIEGIAFDRWGRYGGGFLASTFTMQVPDSPAHNLDRIFTVSLDGQTVRPLSQEGLQAITFLTPGPGGVFGLDTYVAVYGTDAGFDGALYTVSPSGELTRFLSGIDVEHVIFDTEGVLGGGMFISDYNGDGLGPSAGRIWRVTPVSSAHGWDAMK